MSTKLPPFEFGIARILDCGFMIEEAVVPEISKIQVGYGMNFVFDVPQSWIQYTIRADFRQLDDNEHFMSGTVMTRFNVSNLSAFVDETGTVKFPEGSLTTLFSIAFSHLRAILSKNITGSRFSDIYVPIVNPADIFHDLLKRNVETFKKMQAENAAKEDKNIPNKKSKGNLTDKDFDDLLNAST